MDVGEEDEFKPVAVEVRVDLDSEYFKWKAQEENGGQPEAATEENPGKRNGKVCGAENRTQDYGWRMKDEQA